MDKVQEWLNAFENNIKVIRKKIKIYEKELDEYDFMIPSDKVKHKARIIELRESIKFYDEILDYYDNPQKIIEDEEIGNIILSPIGNNLEYVETEYGKFEVIYRKSKLDLIDEYYETIENLNQLCRIDKANINLYKKQAEILYFKYAILINNAPYIEKGEVQNQMLNAGTEKDYQKHINTYRRNDKEASNEDVERENLISELHLLEDQLSDFSSSNSIEVNELRVKITDLKVEISRKSYNILKIRKLSEIALVKSQTVKGKFTDDYCAYLISKIDSDFAVDCKLAEIELYNSMLENYDAKLRLIALNDNKDEKERAYLLKEEDSIENLLDKAYADLSNARRERLRREILHAYNVGSISNDEKYNRLKQLESYIVINEAVENEVSLYTTQKDLGDGPTLR